MIRTGELSAGEKLPSKRSLASHNSISVITVETAYSQLLAEGYIYSKPQSGYYVNDIDFGSVIALPTAFAEPESSKAEKYDFEFRTNAVEAKEFPFSVWASLMREILRNKGEELLKKTDSQGLYALRCEIAAYLKAYRNIFVSPSQIIIGAGSEYLINIIIQLLGKNKKYAVENPGYHKIARILKANGIECEYIPIDEGGISVEELKKSGADIIHVTPSHHFPLGIVTPIARRYELLAWARAENGYIIEDDYDSEFRSNGRPIPALQSLDTAGRVIYLNTFAKTLAPSLRIGYAVLPKQLIEVYKREFGFYSGTVSVFEQYTLAIFMERRYFEQYINKMRVIYKNRLKCLIQAINKSSLAKFSTISGENAGLHILLNIDNKMNEDELVRTAKKAGVFVAGVSSFYYGSSPLKPTVILGYAGIGESDIPAAVQRLEAAWIKDGRA